MHCPYKRLDGTESDLQLLRGIDPRAFILIETYSKRLELKAVEGRLVGYSDSSKSCRVYNPPTRRAMECRNVVFTETPSHLFPPPLEETSQRNILSSNGMGNPHYIADNDFRAIFAIALP